MTEGLKMNEIKSGVWPTMITPYTKDNNIDFDAMETLIEWYINKGVAGIFAVCMSSEMHYLSEDERIAIAEFTVRKAAGRVQVVATGNVSENQENHIDEIKKMAATGVEAVILLSNNILGKGADEKKVRDRLHEIITSLPKDVMLGIYECPVPFKFDVPASLVKWMADTGRFVFFKETSCDIDIISAKIEAARNSKLKVFNANSAFLTDSYKNGAEGYCGVLANFFPDLLAWHFDNYKDGSELSESLQNYFGAVAAIETRLFPVCAKDYLKLEGISMNIFSRNKDVSEYRASFSKEVEQLKALVDEYRQKLIE